tara:strand:+ start:2792 stop:4468 length:1677 start_codon:yes stop_codon:yes gene_type:complete
MRFIIFILSFLLFQTNTYSNTSESNKFNQKYLSDYFSALISSKNQNNDDALKFFNSSKFLIKKHDNFLKEYVFSLVLDGQVKKAINQIKISKNEKNSNFFEANLLLTVDSFKKKDFKQVSKRLKELDISKDDGTYEFVIFKILENYNHLFIEKKIKKQENDFGNLNLINSSFQNCYINSNITPTYFTNLINDSNNDYSRYLFFYFSYLVQNKEFSKAKDISKSIVPLTDTLLISQSKEWIENEKFEKFTEYFSCYNETDILSEFFFLISNLFSSQEIYDQSNFYLRISEYLNKKFYFNLSLLAENHYLNNNFEYSKIILNKFKNKDDVYNWYRIKKIGKILSESGKENESLEFTEKNFKLIIKPSVKTLYDMANIYRSFKKYDKAIKNYSELLTKVDKDSYAYSRILYRRGSCFERQGNYENADNDLLKSLKINPDAPYTMNYLAYSWLERNYKINEAMDMLKEAYKKKSNDPYITDSVGWGYYLVGDYINAEKYLKKALLLMPSDPIVNDHYGDVLWQLNRKLQAKYFWENVLELEETEDEMKKNIKKKLLNGPKKL